jgi:hypothetical protein
MSFGLYPAHMNDMRFSNYYVFRPGWDQSERCGLPVFEEPPQQLGNRRLQDYFRFADNSTATLDLGVRCAVTCSKQGPAGSNGMSGIPRVTLKNANR